MALPSGYTQLEYIQSSGSQHINTKHKPTDKTRVVCDFQFVKTTSTQYLFCARGPASGYANRFGLLLHSSGYFRSDFGSSNANFSTNVSVGDRHTVDKNGATCSIDGTAVTNTAATFTGSYEMNLFAGNTGGSMSEPASVKIFSCQIYDNGTLVRDFVPAKRNADSVAGLYDIANGVFYTNAGTGVFSYPDPDYVEPVEGHNTLIGGTAYAITGGKTMAGGTVYDIALGKTLVGGTLYEIVFGGKIIVTLSNSGNSSLAYVTINGTKYYTAGNTIECEPGTSITIFVSAQQNMYAKNSTIKLNGTTVVQGAAMRGATYTFTPDADTVTISFSSTGGTQNVYSATITTS